MSNLKDPRVLFAAERTLLAWNRTSIALIAFGFLIERTGLLMSVLAAERTHSLSMVLTFWAGLAFISLGTICAIYSSRQYASILKGLNPNEFPSNYRAKWGTFVNLIVALLGSILVGALFLGR